MGTCKAIRWFSPYLIGAFRRYCILWSSKDASQEETIKENYENEGKKTLYLPFVEDIAAIYGLEAEIPCDTSMDENTYQSTIGHHKLEC